MPDGMTYKHHKYNAILKEQVIISYMSNGVISLEDLDYYCPYDRKLITEILKEIKEQEAQSYNNSHGVRSSRTSRY